MGIHVRPRSWVFVCDAGHCVASVNKKKKKKETLTRFWLKMVFFSPHVLQVHLTRARAAEHCRRSCDDICVHGLWADSGVQPFGSFAAPARLLLRKACLTAKRQCCTQTLSTTRSVCPCSSRCPRPRHRRRTPEERAYGTRAWYRRPRPARPRPSPWAPSTNPFRTGNVHYDNI